MKSIDGSVKAVVVPPLSPKNQSTAKAGIISTIHTVMHGRASQVLSVWWQQARVLKAAVPPMSTRDSSSESDPIDSCYNLIS